MDFQLHFQYFLFVMKIFVVLPSTTEGFVQLIKFLGYELK